MGNNWVEKNRQEYQKIQERNERLYGGFDNYRKYNPRPSTEPENKEVRWAVNDNGSATDGDTANWNEDR